MLRQIIDFLLGPDEDELRRRDPQSKPRMTGQQTKTAPTANAVPHGEPAIPPLIEQESSAASGSDDPPIDDNWLRVYRYKKDGDLLVYDGRTPGEGYTQFWSPAQGDYRRFIYDTSWNRLELVTDDSLAQPALRSYVRFRGPGYRASASASASASAAAPPSARRAPPQSSSGHGQSPELRAVLEKLSARDGSPVFVTGRAGTGKSTVLRQVADAKTGKCIVLAPTGIAALNAGGQTIHSFFKLPLKPLTPSDVRWGKWVAVARRIETLIIDEVSMVRADLLDAIHHSLCMARSGSAPFGGVRLAMFGDPYQLPPVVSQEQFEQFARLGYPTPHFFSAQALKQAPLAAIEFQTVYRQRDPEWIAVLDRLRFGGSRLADFAVLKDCVIPATYEEIDSAIMLTAFRRDADLVNERRLNALPDAPRAYSARRDGTFAESGRRNIDPAPDPLILKRGARVWMG